jgi:hypothetical protein
MFRSATGAADDYNEDVNFFKNCIVDYYCFEKHATEDVLTKFPDFKDLIGTAYFNAMAKRVEFFFARYNTWSTDILNDAKFRDVATGIQNVKSYCIV